MISLVETHECIMQMGNQLTEEKWTLLDQGRIQGGGGGPGGQDTPSPSPLWGTPKLHKEGKNVARMGRILVTVTRTPPPPFPKSCIHPCALKTCFDTLYSITWLFQMYVRMYDLENQNEYLWNRNKFLIRQSHMQEMYNQFEETGIYQNVEKVGHRPICYCYKLNLSLIIL